MLSHVGFGGDQSLDLRLTCFDLNRLEEIYDLTRNNSAQSPRSLASFRCCAGISGARKIRFDRNDGCRGSISKFSHKWSTYRSIAYVRVSDLSERWLSHPWIHFVDILRSFLPRLVSHPHSTSTKRDDLLWNCLPSDNHDEDFLDFPPTPRAVRRNHTYHNEVRRLTEKYRNWKKACIYIRLRRIFSRESSQKNIDR